MAFHGVSPEELATYMTMPAGLPPPGVIADFETPQTLIPTTIAATTISLILTTFFVTMRIYTRHVLLKHLWWDDYFSILAWVLLTCAHAFACKSVIEHGAGTHIWNLHFSNLVQIIFDSVIFEALYSMCMLAAKLSILLQFLRMFVPIRDGNRVMFYATVGLIAANALLYTFELAFSIFECVPVARHWNPNIPGTCFSGWSESQALPTAGFNIASDFLILFLPLHKVWALRVPVRKKIQLSLLFAVGFVACATSILQLYYSLQLDKGAGHLNDGTYYAAVLGFCLQAELTVGIIVGCLPSFPRFATEMKMVWNKRSVLKGYAATPARQGGHSAPEVGAPSNLKDAHEMRQWQRLEEGTGK